MWFVRSCRRTFSHFSLGRQAKSKTEWISTTNVYKYCMLICWKATEILLVCECTVTKPERNLTKLSRMSLSAELIALRVCQIFNGHLRWNIFIFWYKYWLSKVIKYSTGCAATWCLFRQFSLKSQACIFSLQWRKYQDKKFWKWSD